MLSPINRTNKVSLISVSRPNHIAGLWRDQLKIDVGHDFEQLPQIEFWECLETGLRWYEPPAAAGGGELYSQLESFDWYYMLEKWEFEIARNLIQGTNRVLEVGVGFGYFLDSCSSNGIDISGVELNPTAAKRVRDKGLEVFEENLDELANRIGEGNFDAICCFQVLEHVAQPRVFLEGMLRNLRNGGKLILSVPNAAVIRRIDPNNQDLLNQPPHHMSHWDASVFKSLENHLPVRLRSIHREPLASYHVDWIVTGYLRNQFSFLGKQLARALFNRITLFPLNQLIRMGLRKWIPGHALLVEFEKVG